MKKSDLSVDRRRYLVPVEGRSGAFALVPPPPPRGVLLQVSGRKLAMAHEQLGRLQELSAHLPNADLITRCLERREAVGSSQIEGTQTEILELLEYEATGIASAEASADVAVTLNYVHALEQGLAAIRTTPPSPIDQSLIRSLHATLMGEGRKYRWPPGEYRKEQNWIGGPTVYEARFVPPPASQVERCMAELCDYLADPHDPESPFEADIIHRMAIAHASFETIHPFPDGNGRVGRLLMPLMMAREGYVPLYTAGYLLAHRREYYDALAEVQLKGNWGAWIGLLATAVYESAQESIAIAKRMIAIRDDMQNAVAGARSDSVLAALPDLLLASPATSAKQLAGSHGVSFPAAKNALDRMEALGYLKARKVGRELVYVAHGLVDILAGKVSHPGQSK